jgi:hypothetical protein
LRYIDVFDETALKTPDLLSFLATGTNLEIKTPSFIENSAIFENSINGRLFLQRKLRGWADSSFLIDETSRQSFQVLSKVVTEGEGVPAIGHSFRKRVAEWLEFAHDLTSPFFKSFIKENLMSQFEATPK